jgi:isopropylmalate/homocitrate/citramalate synthase
MSRTFQPILFDVTLRDGLQTESIDHYPTEKKKEIFHHILRTYNPPNIEIGSLVNPKILPIMSDSIHLFHYAQQQTSNNIYVLVPTINKLEYAIENKIKNLSFITSVSDSFQRKNTNRSLLQTKNDFISIFQRINREPYEFHNKKLYISCINKCPIMGKIENDVIVREILYYFENFEFDELCISDTCGELEFENFIYIIKKCIILGIPESMFSIHLHISEKNIENIEKIIMFSFDNNIHKFDVSDIKSGGCSVTMNADETLQNLSYDLFYKILEKYQNREPDRISKDNI